MLIAVGAVPLALEVVPLVLEAHGNSISRKAPELLHQAVVQFVLPLTFQERFDRIAAAKEFRSIPPLGTLGVPLCHDLRIATVPGLLRRLDFGPSRFEREWRRNSCGGGRRDVIGCHVLTSLRILFIGPFDLPLESNCCCRSA